MMCVHPDYPWKEVVVGCTPARNATMLDVHCEINPHNTYSGIHHEWIAKSGVVG